MKGGNISAKRQSAKPRYKTVEAGQHYGLWIVVGDVGGKSSNYKVLCQCVCGQLEYVSSYDLLDNRSQSCVGCGVDRSQDTKKAWRSTTPEAKRLIRRCKEARRPGGGKKRRV